MSDLEEIRYRVQTQYRIEPRIHISVSIRRPKTVIENQEATITGVYRNIFQIEAHGNCYTIQYADILTKNVSISEIGAID